MTNPEQTPYSAYVHLLIRLHELIVQHLGEGPEADALRDEADLHWRSLTPQQIKRVRGLSEDLHSIREHLPEPIPHNNLSKQILHTWDLGDWDGVLSLVRHNPVWLRPYWIALLRSGCYEKLGDPEAAAVFKREAARLLGTIAGSFSITIPTAATLANDKEF